MEIKILCACGSKFKFDLEPVNGRAPEELACPNCRTSWTEQANAIIAQSAPAAVAAEPAPIRLNLGGHQAAEEPAPAEAPQTEVAQVAPEPVAAPKKKKKKLKRADVAAFDTGPEPADWGKFALGSVGALVGALVGCFLYYLFFNMGFESKLMALGVAGLAGLGARLIGRKGSNELGLLTGAFSVGAIVLAQYMVAGNLSAELKKDSMDDAFVAVKKNAQYILQRIPNGTEQEIRAHLALEKWEDEDGNRVTPESISAEEVKEFQDDKLPFYRRLADDSVSIEEWKQHEGLDDGALDSDNADEIEFTTKGVFVLLAFSRFNLVCLIAAAGMAYKMTDI